MWLEQFGGVLKLTGQPLQHITVIVYLIAYHKDS